MRAGRMPAAGNPVHLWSLLVVKRPPSFDEHFGPRTASEPLAVEQLVAQLAVEALDEPVLPRAARRNESRTDGGIAQSPHDCRCGEPLQAGVLRLQILQPASIGRIHAAVFVAPAEERLLADVVALAEHLDRDIADLTFAQDRDGLLFGESLLNEVFLPGQGRELTFLLATRFGAGHFQRLQLAH